MIFDDTYNLLQYRINHPKESDIECFNRWQSKNKRNLTSSETQEALFLLSLPINPKLIGGNV